VQIEALAVDELAVSSHPDLNHYYIDEVRQARPYSRSKTCSAATRYCALEAQDSDRSGWQSQYQADQQPFENEF